ncbi:MAG TPA: hypothetical protein VHU91_04080 [Mycobacteriales bacterium]|jgi:hypothetical protein|nr:hypothetical protein [Mycobacteriales bacterium]
MTLTPAEKTELIEHAIEGTAEEERLAAAREIERKTSAKDSVVPVRLNRELYSSVQSVAAQRHLPVSVLLRQWVAQGAAAADARTDVAAELERLAAVVRADRAA